MHPPRLRLSPPRLVGVLTTVLRLVGPLPTEREGHVGGRRSLNGKQPPPQLFFLSSYGLGARQSYLSRFQWMYLPLACPDHSLFGQPFGRHPFAEEGHRTRSLLGSTAPGSSSSLSQRAERSWVPFLLSLPFPPLQTDDNARASLPCCYSMNILPIVLRRLFRVIFGPLPPYQRVN